MTSWWLPALCAALCSAGLIGLRLRWQGGLDRPNGRSLHSVPTPHGGGLGILGGALCGGLWLGVPWDWLCIVMLLGGMSVIDDARPLPFVWRLLVHLACAAWVVLHDPPSAWWLGALLVLAIAWATNAFNFMDGANGFSGSMAACGFLVYGLAWGVTSPLGGWCMVICAAALAFLCFNWDPARIFMGDVGSIPLGFLAGALGWLGVAHTLWPAWFPCVVFAPFWGDATLTLLRRARRGEKVWQAHREHLYQRMVRSGLSHGQMSGRWVLVMAAGGCVALLLLQLPAWAGWGGTVLWCLLLAGLARDAEVSMARRLEGGTR